jgi:hypothetical protein
MQWDETAFGIDNLYDNICFDGVGCFDLAMVGEGNCLSTNHCISVLPSTPSEWVGTVGMILVNVSQPWTGLSEAYLAADGSVVGDPLVVVVRVQLLAAITEGASPLLISDVTAASQQNLDDGGAVWTLEASVEDGRIVTGNPL